MLKKWEIDVIVALDDVWLDISRKKHVTFEDLGIPTEDDQAEAA